jgi:hypothetical protein
VRLHAWLMWRGGRCAGLADTVWEAYMIPLQSQPVHEFTLSGPITGTTG